MNLLAYPESKILSRIVTTTKYIICSSSTVFGSSYLLAVRTWQPADKLVKAAKILY